MQQPGRQDIRFCHDGPLLKLDFDLFLIAFAIVEFDVEAAFFVAKSRSKFGGQFLLRCRLPAFKCAITE